MSKRMWWILLSVLVVGAMLLAACGPKATPVPTEKPEPTAEPPTAPPPGNTTAWEARAEPSR